MSGGGSETETPRPAAQARPRRATMVDVARHAGVSVKTVSRVVNNAPYVQQELIDRVLTAVAELDFRRNRLASSLRSGQATSTIGLVIEELANPFYASITGAVASVARTHDTLLITASSEENPEHERQLLRELTARRVDGLLVVPTGADHGFLRTEMETGLPVVFLDRPPAGLTADTVLLDNRGGARAAAQRLLSDGHRRIAVLLGPMCIHTMRERAAGVREALAEAGVPEDPALVREGLGSPEAAAAAVGALLGQDDPPTAFFSANNRLTAGVVEALWQRGDEAAVAGFDDFELAHLLPRPVTLVAYDACQLGRRAAELLFARIAGDTSWPATCVLPTRLVERGIRGTPTRR